MPNNKRSGSRSARAMTTEDYVRGIREGNRVVLSRAITLVESTLRRHREQAEEILAACLPATGSALRVGITGAPGVGKSTFIEALGMRLTTQGHRLAVLAVDPTSTRSRGSILGDKTRMEKLSSEPNAFIRPSPSGGSPGGVARRTREAILLCEAAGFDLIFVETVGVGQSETAVHAMVDFFLLLALAGAGDELQGLKRGIVEMADAIAITKADGENEQHALRARLQYENALKILPAPSSGWQPRVHTCSARTGKGLDEIWQTIQDFYRDADHSGYLHRKRRAQARSWMHQTIEHALREAFYAHEDVRAALSEIEASVEAGRLDASAAARRLLALYSGKD